LSGRSPGRSPGRRKRRIYLPPRGPRRTPYLLLVTEGFDLLAAAPEAAFLSALLFLHRVLPGTQSFLQ
jgi:hypothetical protein